ncbi:MAG: cystathionine beta-lyase [Blastocatellia bacterium]|nr:MAG: cystathionine beta-lyase [Blastocatellia bacterium]
MSDYSRKFATLETNVIHSGRPEPRVDGSVVTPVFQSANYLMGEESTYADVRYIRLSNSPNHRVLHARLAVLENTEAALVTSSGMAAITSTLVAFVRSGDHVIAHNSLYGGMQSWFEHDAQRFGIRCTRIDGKLDNGWDDAVRPETKVVYVESITNPLMEVLDLEAIVAFAKRHGLISVIDNTFTSPVNFRPCDLGFDISVHSATKYLNGHSDIVAGAVTGTSVHVERVLHVVNHLGGSLDPHACFLLERGMKTLVLRVERQNENALRLARALARNPAVRRVNYAGLESDPGHQIACRLFKGCGGMLSFYTRTAAQAECFLQRVRIPFHAASLGATETLVVRPARSSHLGLSVEQRARIGVTDDLVRVSVGIESADELIEDFEQALGG